MCPLTILFVLRRFIMAWQMFVLKILPFTMGATVCSKTFLLLWRKQNVLLAPVVVGKLRSPAVYSIYKARNCNNIWIEIAVFLAEKRINAY